ncbi:MAG TPA: hypothetical protein VEB68_00690 [Croceibacterium sp.]|nr:hypothetical protein [Croceibacterium sp.]
MSFFEYMMRRAAPVLFWTAVLLFIGGVATTLLLELNAVTSYGGDSGISARSFMFAVYQALSGAVWPFLGAGLIWTLQQRWDGREQ